MCLWVHVCVVYMYTLGVSVHVWVFQLPLLSCLNVFMQSEMTLNYWVIVERYPFLNEVVGGSIPAMKASLYLTEKTSQVGRKIKIQPQQDKQ